jgi:hypothetical protein
VCEGLRSTSLVLLDGDRAGRDAVRLAAVDAPLAVVLEDLLDSRLDLHNGDPANPFVRSADDPNNPHILIRNNTTPGRSGSPTT